ncbi:MAG: hypothetical protein IPG71_10675 [bacterium]|nr:hypothetical protein [bacterium]
MFPSFRSRLDMMLGQVNTVDKTSISGKLFKTSPNSIAVFVKYVKCNIKRVYSNPRIIP